MTEGKRRYVPKTKGGCLVTDTAFARFSNLRAGCHECSQRRIHCDRSGPSCAKCIAKGIRCSGLGLRYRFNDDVVSKGRNSKNREPDSYKPNATSNTKTSRPEADEPASQPEGLINAQAHQNICDKGIISQTWSSSSESPNYNASVLTNSQSDDDPDALEENSSPPTFQHSRRCITETMELIGTSPNDASDSSKRHFLLYCKSPERL